MTRNFKILVNKLNRFRNRYYTYKFLKGILLTCFILLILFTVFSIAEYLVYFPVEVRKILFFGFIIFGGMLTFQFIFIPLLKMFQILKPIDSKTSSGIIQKHFSDIKDKLLNIIELSEISDTYSSKEIVFASIDQKIDELQLFDFGKAVKYKNLKLVFVYFFVSIIITGVIYSINNSIFTTAPNRIINYNTEYIKPAPYTYNLLNAELTATKGESFKILMESEGNEVPMVVYVNIEGNNYLMKNTGAGKFEYEMASVINPVNFFFTDLKYHSENYFLQLLPKPGISNFDIEVTPPPYTNLPVQNFENIGDIQVPAGTNIKWKFKGIDIDTLYMVMSDSLGIEGLEEENAFHVKQRVFNSTGYHVYIKNDLTEPDMALSYKIDVIPDMYPEIRISRLQDSLKMTRFFFRGSIGDDYGFTALKFHYNINNNDSVVSIPFVKQLNDQDFYFSFDFADLKLSSGSISYYFSVTDNDAINGYKTTTSDSYIFNIPDRREIAENENEQFEKLDKMVQESEKLAKDIQNDLQNLRLKNMDPNISEWEKTQMVNEVLSKQDQLEQLYEKIKKDNEQLNNYKNSFSEQNQKIIEKQKQIEELLEEVFTDELKKLLEEFQKLAEEFDSKKLNQLTERLNLTYEDLQKQLDRNLEMLRRMKVEQKLQNIIDDINRMAAEEDKMADSVYKETDFDSVGELLNQHQQNINDLKDQLNDALQLNQELERQLNFDKFENEFEDIQKSIDDSRNNLDKKELNKAGESMKKSSEKMKNTASAMQKMLDSNESQQNFENIQNLRQILSNLVYLSFEQEKVLVELSGIHNVDPSLQELNKIQKKIKDQSRIVKDSLYALAKRTPQINSMVNNELITMEFNLDKAINEMSEGLYPNARSSQQFVMTATNNLALMLNEALENLEQHMANAQPGDQKNNSQGQGKPGMNLLKEQAESIKEQLQKMIDQMKQGGSENMNQQLGQSLMQHEMMQKMLREIMNSGGIGNDAKKSLQQIDDILEQNRRQLMNKNVNSQMIARQNLINTRLLEAEKAEMEREYEEKRESKTAEDFYSNPVQFFEYREKNNPTIENLNRNSHRLSNFYNNKYKQYLNNMQILKNE